jgi:hypothetical protein
MHKYIKAFLASLLITPTVNAAVINMSFFMADDLGYKHYIEKPLWCYGYDDAPCKYTGTTWKVTDPYGRTTSSSEVYFDCKDSTWGLYTPTTNDIQSGTVLHEIFKLACW